MRERKRLVKGMFSIVFIVLVFPLSLFAQITFERTYGGPGYESGFSVQQTNDNGYILTGATGSPFSDFDVYLVKTDSLGDTLWIKTYGGIEWEYGYSVQQTKDARYIITGFTKSFAIGGKDVYLIRTDSLGDTLWTRTYGGVLEDCGSSVQETQDDGYIIVGYTASFGAGSSDVYLIKTDSLGDTLWTRTYGGTENDYGMSVQETSDSGYIIAGYTWSFGSGGFDVYLIRTDSLGDTLWTKTYGWGAGNERGYSVQQTSDGGYIIAGQTNHFILNLYDVYLIKTDSLGDTLWTRIYYKYQPDADHSGRSVQETSDGGYIVAGYASEWPLTDEDVYLIKTDSLGDTLWTRTYGGFDLDWGTSVRQTNDGGYIIAGSTYSFGNECQVYLIKTDTLGNVGIRETEERGVKREERRLYAHPNPFTETTVISVQCQVPSDKTEIILRIYDLSGRIVKSFSLPTAYSLLPTGVTWDGTDDNGMKVKNGIYFIRLTGNKSLTSRVILIR